MKTPEEFIDSIQLHFYADAKAAAAAWKTEIDAEHEAEKRALREQLAEALAANDRLTASFMKRCEINNDIRARIATVTRERDEARTILTAGLDLLAFIGDKPINNVERKIAAWARQAWEALPFTAARDCQNATAGCHTPMACESAGRCEWPNPVTP